MDATLYQGQWLGYLLVITPWRLIGYIGVLLFTGRWFVQLWASQKEHRPVMPRAFWYMSVSGSVLLVCYFAFGRRDSVGLMSNLFPMLTALYNLRLDLRLSQQPGGEVALHGANR